MSEKKVFRSTFRLPIDDVVSPQQEPSTEWERFQQKRMRKSITKIQDAEAEAELYKAKVEARKAQREAEAMESEEGVAGSPQASPMGILISSLVGQGMDPKKASEFIKGLDQEAMAKLMMLGAQGTQSRDWVLSYMAFQGNRSSSPEEWVKATKEILQVARPSDTSSTLVLEMLKMMNATKDEAHRASVQHLQESVQKLEGQGGIEAITKVVEAMKALGVSPASQSVEVANLQIGHERWKAERDWEMQKWMAEKGLEDKKVERILDFIQPHLERAAPIIDSAVKAAGNKMNPSPDTAPQTQAMVMDCWQPEDHPQGLSKKGGCRNQFVVKPGQTEVECPYCKSVWRAGVGRVSGPD